MEQRLESIRPYVQTLAAVLEIGEEITMDCDQVTLKNSDREASKYIILHEKKKYAE
ncbi:6831_t:CDS:1, partial [Racocetra fulgida]